MVNCIHRNKIEIESVVATEAAFSVLIQRSVVYICVLELPNTDINEYMHLNFTDQERCAMKVHTAFLSVLF